jgi:hypothetical protein
LERERWNGRVGAAPSNWGKRTNGGSGQAICHHSQGDFSVGLSWRPNAIYLYARRTVRNPPNHPPTPKHLVHQSQARPLGNLQPCACPFARPPVEICRDSQPDFRTVAFMVDAVITSKGRWTLRTADSSALRLSLARFEGLEYRHSLFCEATVRNPPKIARLRSTTHQTVSHQYADAFAAQRASRSTMLKANFCTF